MSNVFVSVLDEIGSIGKDIFKEIPAVVNAAAEAEPVVALLLPNISPLYNLTVSLVQQWEAAANAAGIQKAGAQKKLAVLSFIKPFAIANAASMGIVVPTDAQLSKHIDNVVADQKTFQALPIVRPK